ncbi:hypothetical protein ACET3X_003707 [Alternaria dauci]|uniref:Uncharacterized protein n=1 Tax=Alternaria dauci TaxID=48095 RepID=A0ABR3UKT9_9PLEO
MLRNDSLFVDGGVQISRKNGTTWLGFSKYIFEIDMSTSWDATTNFTEKRIGRFGNSAMNANPPNMVRGALYRGLVNNRRLFTFGGSTFLANKSDPDWKLPASDDYSLWSYDTESMLWAQYDLTHAVPRRPNWGANAEAWPLGLAFYLNGMVDKGSSIAAYTMTEYINGTLQNDTDDHITYVQGLNVINMDTQVARNVPTDSLGAPRIAGGLVWGSRIGKSRNGTLVAMGGMRSANQRIDTFRNGILIDFATVSLCDTFHETDVRWYNQSTTGDIPPPRIDFCTMPSMKYAEDNSSSNIYIYGGYDPMQAIMSTPAITLGGSLDAGTYSIETTGQPLVLNTLKCDEQAGVALFDLSECTWGSSFDTHAPAFELPTKVVEKIGGTRTGGAAVVEPSGGFAHLAISAMFNPPAATSILTQANTTDTVQIAGAVVGAVAGSSILVILLVWVMVKRRKAQRSAEPHTALAQDKEEVSSTIHELPAVSRHVEADGQRHIAELGGETGSFGGRT